MTETQVATNAEHAPMAEELGKIAKSDQGTLTLLKLRKKGVTRGPSGSKTTYDDDLVEVLIWSGFAYKALVERSWNKLMALQDEGEVTIKGLRTEAINQGATATSIEDVCVALQELTEQHLKIVNGTTPTGPPHPGATWEPLLVDGKEVQGSKVYRGKGDILDPRAPVPGTIYVQGVKLGEKVLEPAVNGHWSASHKPKTVVKRIITKQLPSGLYVQYVLDPEHTQMVKVGDAAANQAKTDGVPIDPMTLRSLFKIAP